ncbi:hypothetical protein Tco_0340715 [Tanacetum coccineum]
MHNVVAFLEKPIESDGFVEIIDFLKARSIHYALIVNPIIYTSCIEQFWATAKSSIRRDLHLDDAEGTDCLPTATIFKELARMGKRKGCSSKGDCFFKEEDPEVGKEEMSRPTGLKRLKKVGMFRRVVSFEDQESLGDPEDASKQGRSITDLDKDDDVTLVDETQERQDYELMFDTGVLDADEMPVEAKVDEKDEQSTKLDDSTAAKPKVVTTAATTTTIRPKARGVVVQEPSEFRALQEVQPSISKDKGKSIMIVPEVPLKRKDQISLDEQIARDIQANYDGGHRLLAERLQSKERKELTDEEKGKLFMELKEKRRKHFTTLRAQEKRNKPLTKAQKRTQMSTYLKHMGGYTYKQLNGKSFDEIHKLFDNEMKRVNTFMAMGSGV